MLFNDLILFQNLFVFQVNDWFSEVITTAPPELRGGFFTSYLGFYDVQSSLTRDTLWAVGIAVVVAVAVLLASTLSLLLSLLSAATVCAVVSVSVGALLGLGWRLNVLESVAVTLVIGLSVDFTLHYAVMYKVSAASRSSASAKAANGASKQQQRQQQPNGEAPNDKSAAPSSSSSSETDVVFSVSQMAAPVSMSALTTLAAGLCLLPSRVLAYVQVGTFIAVVMATSLLYSTFFFQSLLSVFAPARTCSPPRRSNEVVERARYYFVNRGEDGGGERGLSEGDGAGGSRRERRRSSTHGSFHDPPTEESGGGADLLERQELHGSKRGECFTVQQAVSSSASSVDRDILVAGSAVAAAGDISKAASNATNLSTFTSVSAATAAPPAAAAAEETPLPSAPPLPGRQQQQQQHYLPATPPPPPPLASMEGGMAAPPPAPPNTAEVPASALSPQIITLGHAFSGERGKVSTCDIHISMSDVTVVDGFTGPQGLQMQRAELAR